jgi:hypothetical protein
MKILNPLGFKLLPAATLQRYFVIAKGHESPRGTVIRAENVWWLVHPNNKNVVAAYVDPRFGGMRELSLKQCVDIWGWSPDTEDEKLSPEEEVSGGSSPSSKVNHLSLSLSSFKH